VAVSAAPAARDETAAASSTHPGTSPIGPLDGTRFSQAAVSTWRGEAGHAPWIWELKFARPRRVGAILQIVGDDAEVFQNAPKRAVWQVSDGKNWTDLERTRVDHETRMFRLHRLEHAHEVHGLRMVIDEAVGEAPTLREIEIYAEPTAKVEFPDWIACVSTVDNKPDLLKVASPFVTLARQCEDWKDVKAQRLWMGDFDQEFTEIEPRPLCAFLTGNYRDWCEQDRNAWRGIGTVLGARSLPIWASCGGAQGLAILEETGVDRPWDCPRCRDPQHPKLPIYTHIGHTGPAPCGNYKQNLAERGRTNLKIETDDPVLAGLKNQFVSMESHIGQIAYPPKGWTRLVTAGDGAKTANQLIRLDGRPIYAAQFHIEMVGAPETSKRIMTNFLHQAQDYWRTRSDHNEGIEQK
jgi:hypothetical protein